MPHIAPSKVLSPPGPARLPAPPLPGIGGIPSLRNPHNGSKVFRGQPDNGLAQKVAREIVEREGLTGASRFDQMPPLLQKDICTQ